MRVLRPSPEVLWELREKLERKRRIRCSRSDDGRYEVCTYATWFDQWYKFMREPEVALFRSLVFRTSPSGGAEDAWISMTKFPNLQEASYSFEPVLAYKKVDGSLVAVSYDRDEGELIVRSKSSFTSFIAEDFRGLLMSRPELEEGVHKLAELSDHGSANFELVCALPKDTAEELFGKEVRLWAPADGGKVLEPPHGHYGPVLLQAICMNGPVLLQAICMKSAELGTLRAYLLNVKLFSYDPLRVFFHLPDKFRHVWPEEWVLKRLSAKDFDQLEEALKRDRRLEGFVVFGKLGEDAPRVLGPLTVDPLIKFKSREYVLLVHYGGRVDILVRMCMYGKCDDVYAVLPDDQYLKVREIAEDLERIAELLNRLKEREDAPRIVGTALKQVPGLKDKARGKISALLYQKRGERITADDLMFLLWGTVEELDSNLKRVKEILKILERVR